MNTLSLNKPQKTPGLKQVNEITSPLDKLILSPKQFVDALSVFRKITGNDRYYRQPTKNITYFTTCVQAYVFPGSFSFVLFENADYKE
jgi:hypothetical protein